MTRAVRYESFWLIALWCAGGCYRVRASEGGGQVPPRGGGPVNASDIAIAPGYEIDAVARSLTYPTGVTFDGEGNVFVVESGYSYGEDFTTPRLLRVRSDGGVEEIVKGKNGPWTGVTYDKGSFYVAEGGETEGGRILKISRDGKITALVEGLPSLGDHHTNGPVIGSDGYVYFGQGTFTNSAVVGEENYKFGWLKRHPEAHDIPCRDVTLNGANFESDNPLTPDPKDKTTTGAYSPFGKKTERGQVVRGEVPCSGAVMRVPLAGGKPELVAWGFRNPFGLAFAPSGKLYATDNAYDMRGSRPIWGAADVLWEVKNDVWYGWPDYSAGLPLAQKRFKPPGGDEPIAVLAQAPGPLATPIARFGVHSSSDGIDFSRNAAFGFVGQAFVAQFGDQTPATGKVLFPVGFRVVRVEMETGVVTDFVANKGDQNGPASKLKTHGLERPLSVRFDPEGTSLYIVDFGEVTMSKEGSHPARNSGVLWRVRPTGGAQR